MKGTPEPAGFGPDLAAAASLPQKRPGSPMENKSFFQGNRMAGARSRRGIRGNMVTHACGRLALLGRKFRGRGQCVSSNWIKRCPGTAGRSCCLMEKMFFWGSGVGPGGLAADGAGPVRSWVSVFILGSPRDATTLQSDTEGLTKPSAEWVTLHGWQRWTFAGWRGAVHFSESQALIYAGVV
jgi:hypothetical protein